MSEWAWGRNTIELSTSRGQFRGGGYTVHMTHDLVSGRRVRACMTAVIRTEVRKLGTMQQSGLLLAYAEK